MRFYLGSTRFFRYQGYKRWTRWRWTKR